MNGPTIRYWNVEWCPDWIRFGRIGDKLNRWDRNDYLEWHRDTMDDRVRESVRKFHEGIDDALDEAIERLDAL